MAVFGPQRHDALAQVTTCFAEGLIDREAGENGTADVDQQGDLELVARIMGDLRLVFEPGPQTCDAVAQSPQVRARGAGTREARAS